MSRPARYAPRVLGLSIGFGLMAASFALGASPAAASVPVPVIAAVSGGYTHSCALTTGGGVMCWGANNFGQLGDGTTTQRSTPVDVSGLSSGVAAIASGADHTCALTTAGAAKCWGRNTLGQLGDGTLTDRFTPVDVRGLTSGVAAISAGGFNTCALTTSDGLKCWGTNDFGALGNGSTTDLSDVPVDVASLGGGVAAVSVGGGHTCALTASGGVKCWGYDFWGELGDGTDHGPEQCGFYHTPCSHEPFDVSGLTSGTASISAGGSHTCALSTSGGVKCWGANNYGQLGDGDTVGGFSRSTVPLDVPGLSNGIAVISAGGGHNCVLTTAGGVNCWGDNRFGQLGLGYTTVSGGCSCVPTPTASLRVTKGVSAISAGGGHTCVVTASGGMECWGNNRSGQLGVGTTTNTSLPVRLFRPAVSDIASSLSVGQPISASGQVWVTTTWSGADPYATITSYEAQMQIKEAGWSDVALTSPTATSLMVLLTPGQRYNFRIRATDSSGNASLWSPGVGFTLNALQETAASYAGTWTSRTLAGSWGGTVERSTELNASASFTFTGARLGRTFTWVGTKGPTYGSADVYLDGVLVTTIDCNAGATMKRQMLFRTDLDTHRHTVTIVNDATAGHPRIDIDGFLWFRSSNA